MVVTIRADLEDELREQVEAGAYPSADELVNAALEQFMADAFDPGELEQLLAVGAGQAAAGQFVEEADVVRRMAELSRARRGRP